jgi:hypothetical protein
MHWLQPWSQGEDMEYWRIGYYNSKEHNAYNGYLIYYAITFHCAHSHVHYLLSKTWNNTLHAMQNDPLSLLTGNFWRIRPTLRRKLKPARQMIDLHKILTIITRKLRVSLTTNIYSMLWLWAAYTALNRCI